MKDSFLDMLKSIPHTRGGEPQRKQNEEIAEDLLKTQKNQKLLFVLSIANVVFLILLLVLFLVR